MRVELPRKLALPLGPDNHFSLESLYHQSIACAAGDRVGVALTMAMVRASCSVLILAHTIICTGAFVPTSGPPCHSSELLSSCSLGCCLPATKPLVLRSTSTRGRADLVSLRASEDEKDGDFEAFFAEQKALAQRGKASAGPVAVGDVLKNEGQDWTVVAERKRERSSKVRTYDAIDNSNQQRVLIKALSLRDMAGAWDVLDDLKREARLLKSVRHSGIPARIDDFEVRPLKSRHWHAPHYDPTVPDTKAAWMRSERQRRGSNVSADLGAARCRLS